MLEEYQDKVYRCIRCGVCRAKYDYFEQVFRVCPCGEHKSGFESDFPRGKVAIAQSILEDTLTYSEKLAQVIYECALCANCREVCGSVDIATRKPLIDVPQIIKAMRQDIVAAGLGPPVRLKEIDSRVMRWHNRFGARPDRRSQWTEKEFELPQKGDLLYFAGCFASYSRPEIARSTVAILKKAGLDPAYLGNKEWCCGVVQFHDGSISLAEETAKHNVEAIKASGAKKVVTSCAECYKSFKIEYPEILGELPFEVVHISAMLAGLIAEGKISLTKELTQRKITFHDPCQLGRYCSVYNPPRDVLKAIPHVELVEMPRHMEYAWCCGNGADVVRLTTPEIVVEIAEDRIEEAKEVEAEAIVSACPRCESNLNRVAEGMKVYDLTLAVAKAMDIDVAVVPCLHQCPAEIDIPRYVRFIREGKFAEALAVIREKVPFPGVLGRVCFHPCEGTCRRGELNESIAIRTLKRFASEHDNGLWRASSKVAPATGKRVAIIGSGPAGLTAAYYLAKLGHTVTVFEAFSELGGMLRVGIPEYRLPQSVVQQEIDEILKLGIEVKLSTTIGPELTLADLKKQGFEAIFIATGAHQSKPLEVEGVDLEGVLQGVYFLKDLALGKVAPRCLSAERIIVVGGGNVAIDVARSSLRLGAREVHLVCLESRKEMPAYEWEIEAAAEEGVILHCSQGPKRILGSQGKVTGLECMLCTSVFDEEGKFSPTLAPGTGSALDGDRVIIAIGQACDCSFFREEGVEITPEGTVAVDPLTLATSSRGVFAGGDNVSGPASVIEAIAAGRKAAISIDQYLGGDGLIDETLAPPEEAAVKVEQVKDDKWRPHLPTLPVAERLQGFIEVELGITAAMAIEEAKRCLRCDLELRGDMPRNCIHSRGGLVEQRPYQALFE